MWRVSSDYVLPDLKENSSMNLRVPSGCTACLGWQVSRRFILSPHCCVLSYLSRLTKWPLTCPVFLSVSTACLWVAPSRLTPLTASTRSPVKLRSCFKRSQSLKKKKFYRVLNTQCCFFYICLGRDSDKFRRELNIVEAFLIIQRNVRRKCY